MGPNTSLPTLFFAKARSFVGLTLSFLTGVLAFLQGGGPGALLVSYVPGLDGLSEMIQVVLANGDAIQGHVTALERVLNFILVFGGTLWVYAERLAPNFRLVAWPTRWGRGSTEV